MRNTDTLDYCQSVLKIQFFKGNFWKSSELIISLIFLQAESCGDFHNCKRFSFMIKDSLKYIS